jgi:hypothetical protein
MEQIDKNTHSSLSMSMLEENGQFNNLSHFNLQLRQQQLLLQLQSNIQELRNRKTNQHKRLFIKIFSIILI